MDLPEFLWDELFYLLVPFYDEPKSGKLAWAIAYNTLLLYRVT